MEIKERITLDVYSKRGIGKLELSTADEQWQKPIILRLHLRGLESLRIDIGTFSVTTSFMSSPPYLQRCELKQAGEPVSTPLKEDSPFWIPTRIENRGDSKDRVIPLETGYFEVTIPELLFHDNPPSLVIQWIDFFR